MCDASTPATPISYSVTIPYTTANSINFTFPQFNPATGNLSCISMKDTISGVTSSFAINSAPDSMASQFLLTLISKVSGPGMSTSHTFTKMYPGDDEYDTLAPKGLPGSTVSYGPDTLYSDYKGSASTGANAAYVGTGTINIVYSVSGGLIVAAGANDTTGISTVIKGTVNLTYYWCPAVPLPVSITNFTAFKKGRHIQLQWLAPNQNNSTYEIEYSKNGQDYSPLGTIPSGSPSTGTVTQYQYQYNINPADMGELYFRIKQKDADGKISYSAVKLVNLEAADQQPGIHTYPNPVVNTVSIQFDEKQTGNFIIELVNITGQVMQQKPVTLSGSSFINLNFSNRPAKGLYFLRAKDLTGNKQYLTKILVD